MSNIPEGLDAEVKSLAFITDKPSLVALSYALRHPETWPSDFVWNYRKCTTCAVGLALRLWPSLKLPKNQKAQETWVAREMALPLRVAKHIFFNLAPGENVIVKRHWFRSNEVEWQAHWDAVTPDDVADAIDLHLRGGD